MAKAKDRAGKFEDERLAKDFDIEGEVEVSEHGSDSEVSEDENAGTEHYVTVGKSKLREKEGASLGPKYSGARVSRKALEQESEQDSEDDKDEEGFESANEEFDDPEMADLARDEAEASDSEISSDNALGESDDEQLDGFVFRGSSKPKSVKGKNNKRATAADFMSSSDGEGAGEGGADVEEDEDGMSGVELEQGDDDSESDDGMNGELDELINGGADSDESEEEDDDAEEEDDDEEEESDEEDESRDKEKKLDSKPTLAALSNSADVEKGLAIQKQRKVYDGLLNLRLRLQKALIAANTFSTLDSDSETESEPYEAAEEAAIKLLNTISSLKDNFGSSRPGDKRKRELDASMSNEDMWEQMQEEEKRYVKFREDRLEKWSRKVQTVNVTTKALGDRNKTLIAALQDQLSDPDNRLAKRSRIARSCAPAQAAKGAATEHDNIYDDADFYQQLLKELVDQRTVESNATGSTAVPSVMMTATKEAKLRKNVDRKASKGRKMRFTVHEKLQNFMAPEDRRAWEQDAIDRLFGTLFGRKMALDENESDEDDMEVDAEEAGLRLFRN